MSALSPDEINEVAEPQPWIGFNCHHDGEKGLDITNRRDEPIWVAPRQDEQPLSLAPAQLAAGGIK